MADYEENEPFLIGEEAQHEDEHEAPEIVIPANKQFKHVIKALSIAVSACSGLGFIILLAVFISVQVQQLNYAWPTTVAAVDLGVCILVAFVFTTLNFFIQLPILINIVTDITFSVVVLVYASNIFGLGWPRMEWCPSRLPYPYPPYNDPGSPPAPRCTRFVIASRVLMGVGGGLGFVVGFIFLAILLLRIVALSRTKFWKRKEFFAPGEYNYQLSFTITKKTEVNDTTNTRGRSVQSRASAAEAPLIET